MEESDNAALNEVAENLARALEEAASEEQKRSWRSTPDTTFIYTDELREFLNLKESKILMCDEKAEELARNGTESDITGLYLKAFEELRNSYPCITVEGVWRTIRGSIHSKCSDGQRIAEEIKRLGNLKSLDRVNKSEESILPKEYNYPCLPLCLIDAVWSIGAQYRAVQNVIDRYWRYLASSNMKGVSSSDSWEDAERCVLDNRHTIEDLIELFESLPNATNSPSHISKEEAEANAFADKVARNRQRTSTTSGILKAQAVLECAKVLKRFGITKIDDFKKSVKNPEKLSEIEKEFAGVPGQGSGISFRYLGMLCGSDTIKPDRHILAFLKDTLDREIKKEEASDIFQQARKELEAEGVDISLREMDYLVWNSRANA